MNTNRGSVWICWVCWLTLTVNAVESSGLLPPKGLLVELWVQIILWYSWAEVWGPQLNLPSSKSVVRRDVSILWAKGQRDVFEWSSLSCRQTATFNQERRQTDRQTIDRQIKRSRGKEGRKKSWHGVRHLSVTLSFSISHFISLFGFCPFVQSEPAEGWWDQKSLLLSVICLSSPLYFPPRRWKKGWNEEMVKWWNGLSGQSSPLQLPRLLQLFYPAEEQQAEQLTWWCSSNFKVSFRKYPRTESKSTNFHKEKDVFTF